MLILTRRIGETLMVGDDVTITVLGAHRNQVRLGTNAPKSVAVHREEIYEQIQAEKYDTYVNTDASTRDEDEFSSSELHDDDRHTGTISHLNVRGYGFIYLPGCEDRIYFHAKSLLGVEFSDLEDGQDVEFILSEGNDGLVATDVSLSNVGTQI